MTDLGTVDTQVALYIDWDNIVMSRYDELHGRNSFRDDRANSRRVDKNVEQKLAQARIDLTAILEYASSYGSVAIARAYANWADPLNASYGPDMLRASVDLVQMFPMSKSKNGADIRLAIDVIDDLARHAHITHVVVVAGDSDYISLAQRCKRLGRGVVGVGAARHTGQFWEAACDEFRYYSLLPGVAGDDDHEDLGGSLPQGAPAADDPEAAAGALLARAAKLGHARSAGDWVSCSWLKLQMKRLDPAFDETLLGHKTFTQFVKAYPDVVWVRSSDSGTQVRLVTLGAAEAPTDGQEPQDDRAPAAHGGRPSRVLVDPRIAAMRADLNQPATAVFGTLGEQACVRGIRLAWQMAEDEEGLASLPSRQIARQLVEEGCPEPLARRAMGVMGLVTSLTRDPTMRYEPNVEMTDADDEQLLSLLRQTIASRMQHRRYPDTVTAEQVTAAVHGDDAPAAAVDAYRHALSLSPLQVMADALTPVLMPAPVLWDVATAVTHLPQSWVLSTTEQFRGAVLAPLESLERDIDTVPMEAAYLALRSSGVLDGPEGDIRNAYADGQPTEVAERVVRTWVTTLLQRRLLVPAELMSMESLYRLVLPDRVQTEGRAWVRDIVASSID